jgi:putative membrane protein
LLPELLHIGHSIGLDSWNVEPSIVIGAMVVLGLYVFQTGRAPEAVSEWRILSFLGGVLIMFLALASPLDGAAHRSLSMHMAQHVLLTTVGPPLLLLGLTPALLGPLVRRASVARALSALTNPVVTGAAFVVNMWLWHIPPVYSTALDYLPVHILMHLSFMATGLMFWAPVVRVLGNLTRMNDGGRLLYLFATGFPMELLALMLLASGTVLYDYYEKGPGLWGMSALTDQQIAGLIMGALGQAASFVAITLLFFRFLDREEREAQQRHRGEPVDAA